MVHTYDPSKISLIVGLVPITGFSDGSMVKVTRASDAFTKVVGADGIVSRAKSLDKSGEVEIQLVQTAPSNDTLNAFALLDDVANAGVVPLSISDALSNTRILSGHSWVRKLPDIEYGKDLANRTWILDFSDAAAVVGGSKVPA